MNKQFTDVSGTRIAWLDTGGNGPAIIFVHGNSSSSHTFDRQLNSRLADDYRLVALDLPGHGDSGRAPVTEYGLPFYARRVAGLASVLGIHDALLVGWSLGGHVVLECTPDLPEVRGIMIYGTPPLASPADIERGFLPNPDFAAGMTGKLSEAQAGAYARSFLGEKGSAELEAQFVADILATDPNAREGLAMSTTGPFVNEVELMAGLSQPLAVVHGNEERLVNLDYVLSLSIPSLWRGRVQIIDNAGHAPHVETPDAFNRLLGEFAGEVTSGKR